MTRRSRVTDVGPAQVVRRAAEYLERHGEESPVPTAERLLSHVLGTDRSGIYAREGLTSQEAKLFGRALCRRCVGEPVQHVTGEQGFRRLDGRRSPRRVRPAPGDRDPRPGRARRGRGGRVTGHGRRVHGERGGGARIQGRTAGRDGVRRRSRAGGRRARPRERRIARAAAHRLGGRPARPPSGRAPRRCWTWSRATRPTCRPRPGIRSHRTCEPSRSSPCSAGSRSTSGCSRRRWGVSAPEGWWPSRSRRAPRPPCRRRLRGKGSKGCPFDGISPDGTVSCAGGGRGRDAAADDDSAMTSLGGPLRDAAPPPARAT